MTDQEEILHSEDGEAQVSQRDCGCPFHGDVQGQVR